jgi:hypothetical protein
MRIPDRLFALALVRRALFLWIGVRLLVALAGGGGAATSGLIPLTARMTALVVLLVGFLNFLEARRRNEDVLLANLGVAQASVAALSVLPAIMAETAVWMVNR